MEENKLGEIIRQQENKIKEGGLDPCSQMYRDNLLLFEMKREVFHQLAEIEEKYHGNK